MFYTAMVQRNIQYFTLLYYINSNGEVLSYIKNWFKVHTFSEEFQACLFEFAVSWMYYPCSHTKVNDTKSFTLTYDAISKCYIV